MALINSLNKYIKVIKDGSYYIYPSQEAREREKNATSPSRIIQEYESRLLALEANEERQYYDSEVWSQEHDPLENEYQKYLYDLTFYQFGNEYPIMAQTFPDIADSIPEIIESGSVIISSDFTDDEYNIVKEREIFGETRDV